MSVLKAKRKPSQFEVFHHFYKMRKEITDLLLRDFGYDLERADSKVLKMSAANLMRSLLPKKKPDTIKSRRRMKPLPSGSYMTKDKSLSIV